MGAVARSEGVVADGVVWPSGDGRVVVGLDGSAAAEAALDWATAEAVARGWRLERVSVPEGDPLDADPSASRAARGLVEAAAGAELLVVGARGRGGFQGLLLGSVGQRCVEEATLPVAVVRGERIAPATSGSLPPVVVGVDGSPDSQRALRWAVARAEVVPGPLRLVHAWQPPDYGADPAVFAQPAVADVRRRVEHLLGDALELVPATPAWSARVECAAREGGAADVLVEESSTAAVVVVGARGRGAARRLVGSVSARLLRHADCPVVVVPRADR